MILAAIPGNVISKCTRKMPGLPQRTFQNNATGNTPRNKASARKAPVRRCSLFILKNEDRFPDPSQQIINNRTPWRDGSSIGETNIRLSGRGLRSGAQQNRPKHLYAGISTTPTQKTTPARKKSDKNDTGRLMRFRSSHGATTTQQIKRHKRVLTVNRNHTQL